MAGGTRSAGSGYGVDRAVLEASVAGTGIAVQVVSGASAIQSSAAWAQARFRRCGAVGAAACGGRADSQLRAGPRTTVMAHGHPLEVSTYLRSGAVTEPTGISVGGWQNQAVQLR